MILVTKFVSIVCWIILVDGKDNYLVLPDAKEYAKQVSRLPRVVLGVRWTTFKCTDKEQNEYDEGHTGDVYDKLHEAEIDKKNQTINLFIRATYAIKNTAHLKNLFQKLKKTNEVTISLYSDDQYHPKIECGTNGTDIRKDLDVEQWIKLLTVFGPDNVYLQVSDKIRADLKSHVWDNPTRVPYSNASSFIRLDSVLLILFIVVKFVENFLFYWN